MRRIGKIPDEVVETYRKMLAGNPALVPPCTCLLATMPEMGRDPRCKSHNPEERAKWHRENATPFGTAKDST